MERRLYRSRQNRILLGVCGGLGEFFKIDPVLVRVIAVLLLIPGVFPAVIAYFVLSLIIPLEGSAANTPRDSFRENISDVRNTKANLGEEVRTTFENKDANSPSTRPTVTTNRSLYILGMIIVAIGVFFILVNVFGWFWHYFWPVLLIIAGLIVIVLVARSKK